MFNRKATVFLTPQAFLEIQFNANNNAGKTDNLGQRSPRLRNILIEFATQPTAGPLNVTAMFRITRHNPRPKCFTAAQQRPRDKGVSDENVKSLYK